jgi:PRC-barrel domain
MGKELEMKSALLQAGAAACVWISVMSSAAAQEPAQDTRPESRPAVATPLTGGTRLSDLLGRVIQNQRAETLGKIQDLVLDETDGRIAYAVVDFDNDRAGGKLWVVPWDLLRPPAPTDANANPVTRTYLLDLPRDRLTGAPAFASTQWPEIDRAFGRRVYTFYGRTPYWEADVAGSSQTADEQRRRPNTVDPNRSRRDVRPLDRDDLRELEAFPVGMFDPKNMKTVGGVVTSIIEGQTGAENDFGQGIRLMVRRDDVSPKSQDLLVYVGPAEFVKTQQGFTFKQNDRVMLKGAEMNRDDRRVFVATEIVLGDRTLMLREDNGLPLWRRKAGAKVGN